MSRKHQPKPAIEYSSIAGFFRRLAATFYDFLLLIAILFFATALLLPFNHGEAFNHNHIFYPIYLITVSFLFYGWFWTHGGQTLGSRAWKLKVLTIEGKPITWKQAFIRFSIALLSCGLSFLWIIVDRKNCAWHDYFSQTVVFLETTRK